MFAQAYFDNQPLVRVFRDRTSVNAMIADLPLLEKNRGAADESLRAIGLEVVGKWKKAGFGYEANVRFAPRPKAN